MSADLPQRLLWLCRRASRPFSFAAGKPPVGQLMGWHGSTGSLCGCWICVSGRVEMFFHAFSRQASLMEETPMQRYRAEDREDRVMDGWTDGFVRLSLSLLTFLPPWREVPSVFVEPDRACRPSPVNQ